MKDKSEVIFQEDDKKETMVKMYVKKKMKGHKEGQDIQIYINITPNVQYGRNDGSSSFLIRSFPYDERKKIRK